MIYIVKYVSYYSFVPSLYTYFILLLIVVTRLHDVNLLYGNAFIFKSPFLVIFSTADIGQNDNVGSLSLSLYIYIYI